MLTVNLSVDNWFPVIPNKIKCCTLNNNKDKLNTQSNNANTNC